MKTIKMDTKRKRLDIDGNPVSIKLYGGIERQIEELTDKLTKVINTMSAKDASYVMGETVTEVLEHPCKPLTEELRLDAAIEAEKWGELHPDWNNIEMGFVFDGVKYALHVISYEEDEEFWERAKKRSNLAGFRELRPKAIIPNGIWKQ